MYQGAYQHKATPARRRRRRNHKPTLLLLTLVLILGAMVGTTLAYLFTNTDGLVNTFTPANVTVDIDEPGWDEDKTVKNNVTVKNTGDVEAYIRAAVVVTWQDAEGNVYPTAPVEGTDYTVTWTMSGWVKYGGFYYYTSPVAPSKSTGVLLTECKVKDGATPPDGYHLSVEILASAIQSQPATAVQEAWGMTVDSNGNLSVGG